MKRPTYQISVNGNPVTTKHAWNSALKAIPGIIRDHITHGSAREISRKVERKDQWSFQRGRFTWKSSDDKYLDVTVELLEAQ